MLETHLSYFQNGQGYSSQTNNEDSETSESPKIDIESPDSPYYSEPDQAIRIKKQSSFSVESLLKEGKQEQQQVKDDHHEQSQSINQEQLNRQKSPTSSSPSSSSSSTSPATSVGNLFATQRQLSLCNYNALLSSSYLSNNKMDFCSNSPTSSTATTMPPTASESLFNRYNQNPLCTLREWSEQARFQRNGVNFGSFNLFQRQPNNSDLKFSVQSILSNNQYSNGQKCAINQFKTRGKRNSLNSHN